MKNVSAFSVLTAVLGMLLFLSCKKEFQAQPNRPPIANAGSPACDNTDRPLVNAQLIPVGTLSVARSAMAVASAGNKILFAGGETSWCCGGGIKSRYL